jgi:hypothetical protein
MSGHRVREHNQDWTARHKHNTPARSRGLAEGWRKRAPRDRKRASQGHHHLRRPGASEPRAAGVIRTWGWWCTWFWGPDWRWPSRARLDHRTSWASWPGCGRPSHSTCPRTRLSSSPEVASRSAARMAASTTYRHELGRRSFTCTAASSADTSARHTQRRKTQALAPENTHSALILLRPTFYSPITAPDGSVRRATK